MKAVDFGFVFKVVPDLRWCHIAQLTWRKPTRVGLPWARCWSTTVTVDMYLMVPPSSPVLPWGAGPLNPLVVSVATVKTVLQHQVRYGIYRREHWSLPVLCVDSVSASVPARERGLHLPPLLVWPPLTRNCGWVFLWWRLHPEGRL